MAHRLVSLPSSNTRAIAASVAGMSKRCGYRLAAHRYADAGCAGAPKLMLRRLWHQAKAAMMLHFDVHQDRVLTAEAETLEGAEGLTSSRPCRPVRNPFASEPMNANTGVMDSGFARRARPGMT
jgi:hypothetical protein